MHTANTLSELHTARAHLSGRVAFVPTMGNLHAGHMSLVERGLQLADQVIVSIFVNPLQFGPNEDLDAYPRTLEADLAQLKAAGTALVFTPTPAVMYPDGLPAHARVSVPGLTDVLCGASRPGHFDGVTTVVCKLLNLIAADIALFGEKDLQQLLIIKKMVNDLAIPVDIQSVPTARAADGLALSSRNGYLSAAERDSAPLLQQQLRWIADQLKSTSTSVSTLCEQAKNCLVAGGFEPDYLEARCRSDLRLANDSDTDIAIFAAAKLGKTRLIDNIQVDREPPTH